jgi:hypothetical protein
MIQTRGNNSPNDQPPLRDAAANSAWFLLPLPFLYTPTPQFLGGLSLALLD